MIKASANNTGGKLDALLASRRSLAFGWEVLIELQVDRPGLPMERRQLKVNRRGYKIEKGKFIGSNSIIKICYPGEEQ